MFIYDTLCEGPIFLEKTLMMGKMEGTRRRGIAVRWMDSIIVLMSASFEDLKDQVWDRLCGVMWPLSVNIELMVCNHFKML